MKERPILFTGEMVRAILDGRKTQTRRLVKPQPEPIPEDVWKDKRIPSARQFWWPSKRVGQMVELRDMSAVAPLGTIGDRLWVRETFCYNLRRDEGGPAYWYAATDPEPEACDEDGFARYRKDGRSASPWIPSIHMPRQASRIDIEITAVRVERVQDITEEDARAEGMAPHPVDCKISAMICSLHQPPIGQFASLWQSIYANWDANWFVWVYEFRRVKP